MPSSVLCVCVFGELPINASWIPQNKYLLRLLKPGMKLKNILFLSKHLKIIFCIEHCKLIDKKQNFFSLPFLTTIEKSSIHLDVNTKVN